MDSKQFYSNYYITITYFVDVAILMRARARDVACTRAPSIQRVVLSHKGDNELISSV